MSNASDVTAGFASIKARKTTSRTAVEWAQYISEIKALKVNANGDMEVSEATRKEIDKFLEFAEGAAPRQN